MLYGIDIANHQQGMRIPESIDFCIMKASEGFRYVDPCMEGFAQECIRKGILMGFYHFARNGSPEENAVHFYDTVKKYVYSGIMCLDMEDENIPDWGEYAQRFVDKFHSITGVYPLVYASASYLPRFCGYPLVDCCGLWIAGYPAGAGQIVNDPPDFCYDVSPFDFASIWQFDDYGVVSGCDEELDVNVAYMDAHAWRLYANPALADGTGVIPQPVQAPDKDARRWTFENKHVKVDVELKN